MVQKDNKERVKDILTNMGMAFSDADDLIEKSKTTVKKSDEVK